MEKFLEITSFYTCVPEMTIIGCMVSEIWSTIDMFCPFTPLTTQEIRILKKGKKHLEMLSFYTCVAYMTVIWCMVPEEMWSVTDRIFVILDYFLPFYPSNNPKIKIFQKWKKTWRYHHFTYGYQKLWSYDVWFLRYGAWQIEFICHFGPFFTLLPPNNPKTQNQKKI